jgi:hypothetical protein
MLVCAQGVLHLSADGRLSVELSYSGKALALCSLEKEQRMNSYKLILSILLVTVFTACSNVDSSQVVPTEIHTSYSAEYREGEELIQVTAHFSVGGSLGTNVVLDEGSHVKFDGQRLRRDIGLVGFVGYSLERYQPDQNELLRYHDFEYLDNKGRTYRNSVRLPRAIQVQVQPVSPGGDIAVRWWSEESLGSQESISASIAARNGSDPIFASDKFGTREGWIYFRRADWEKHEGREVFLSVCRRNSSFAINAPAAGGHLSLHYCTRKLPVYLPFYP